MKIFSLKDEEGHIHHLNLEQIVEIFPFKEVEYSILSELKKRLAQEFMIIIVHILDLGLYWQLQ